MSFLTDVLEQYNQNFREQGLRTRMYREFLAHDNILRSTVLCAQTLPSFITVTIGATERSPFI